MLIGLRFLNDVSSVNSYQPSTELTFFKGSTQRVYFQLVDLSVDTASQGFYPTGRRYCAPAQSRLQIQFLNLDDAKKLVKTCIRPFPEDLSIWCMDILGTDPIDGSVNLLVNLMQPTGVVKGVVENAMVVR